jgi:trehalose-6-phosphate synthase
MAADERRARLEAIRSRIHEHDIGSWIASQLRDVDRARARREPKIPA